MKPKTETTARKKEGWPRQVTVGRETVNVYRRKTPEYTRKKDGTRGGGEFAYMVANYAEGKRRFDGYPTETLALEAAAKLARQLSERDVIGASMTREQAMEYASAQQALKPFGVTVAAAVAAVAECLKTTGDVSNLHAAVKFYGARFKRTTAKRVADVVAELLAVKEKRSASIRYLEDLRARLGRFAEAFEKDACKVTTAEVQAWLDGLKIEPQTYVNFRRVLHLLFEFAVARGYAADNPVAGVENVKVRNGGDVAVFTPIEIARLLAAAKPDFLPSLAIGAFAGLRSAEIERLEWKDIDLAGRNIVIGAGKAKTASRRIVPIADNLAVWLQPYSERKGKVWPRAHNEFYEAQQATAAATAVAADDANGVKAQPPVQWKANALRHSYASYRFGLTGDAGRVAGECGNSAAVIHRHYRELVKPADADRWFAVKPAEAPANVLAMPVAASV